MQYKLVAEKFGGHWHVSFFSGTGLTLGKNGDLVFREGDDIAGFLLVIGATIGASYRWSVIEHVPNERMVLVANN